VLSNVFHFFSWPGKAFPSRTGLAMASEELKKSYSFLLELEADNFNRRIPGSYFTTFFFKG
jgi:hypothetical protein